MPSQEIIFPSLDALSAAAADLIATQAKAAISDHGFFALALAGGSTPKKLYELLSAPSYLSQVEWNKVHFFFSDERLVPLTDANSNYKLAYDALLSKLPLASTQIHAAPTHLGPPHLAAQAYESDIRSFFSAPEAIPAFDLILLGMGSDGHTASLFPNKASLNETHSLITSSSPGILPPPIDRLTFTLPLINAAHCVLFLVAGVDKRAALAAAQNQQPFEGDALPPAALIQPQSGQLLWYVDTAVKGN